MRQAVPFVTADQMREVDRAAVEEYGLLLIQMMENAGRALAILARRRFLENSPRGHHILILAGTGGNGGGGLVAARWLHNWGADVAVYVTAAPSQFTDVPRHQLHIVERMGVPVRVAEDGVSLPSADLIIDALIGYSLRGAPGGVAASLINAANQHDAPILALDVPSGVDATTGSVYKPAIQAAVTLTLALPKQGFLNPAARSLVGELHLADIGIPPDVYAKPPLSLRVGSIFASDEIVRLW